MFKIFCRCNAAVSDLNDGKSKNKIAVVFFPYFPWLCLIALASGIVNFNLILFNMLKILPTEISSAEIFSSTLLLPVNGS